MKHIVILGGGFAGMEVYKKLHRRMHRRKDIRLTIVDRNNYFMFAPMLHEVATGSVERGHIVHPIRQLVRCCLENFYQAEVHKVDFDKKLVKTSIGDIHYDHLVVALGSQVNYFGTPGAKEHCLPLKTMHNAVTLRNHIIRVFETATKEHNVKKRKQLLSFVVIGGGPTGVELAGQMAGLAKAFKPLYQEIDYKEVSITLVNRPERLLHVFRESTGLRAKKRLEKLGVKVLLKTGAKKITADYVELSTGKKIYTDTPIWTAGVTSSAPNFLDKKWLNKRGQIIVTPELHVPNDHHVFAVGDNAALDGVRAPFAPQTAQAAMDVGKVLAHNLFAAVDEKPGKYKSFHFKQKGYIMPIGDWYAVAEIGPFAFAGRFAWWLRRTVFIQNLRGFINRLRVTIDWTLHMVLHRDTSEL